MIINEKVWHSIISGLFIMFTCLFIGAAVLLFSTTRKLDTARRLNDQLTERVTTAETTNKKLTKSLRQIRFLCGEFEQSTDRNVTTAREAIELIEETRYYVQCIEVECGLWDSDSIYQRIDDWLQNEGVNIDGD